ncbi:hypothetical protein COU54_05365 [Candidatus Pacearchaeota archaeon CG10_big_fil_rev_8_21_14_0_10_31_24]|nr:MAG: hypothetical protein COU54_05365 [Candidatus Pacearchaeota archaeon CG10_big_fil_rev_8_21_14_0_10_31_24]
MAIKKGDFIAFKFSGYSNGEIFDTNIEEDLKKINPKVKAKESIIVVGKEMVVKGLDSAFEDKEIGKPYEIKVLSKNGFGERHREMVKTIPLKIFTEKQINPYPGLVLNMDNMIARIITVSGARVITDFNNPLAGKDLEYKFTITRKVEDESEKVNALFEVLLRMVPEFEIKDKIIIKGPKFFEVIVKEFSDQFKEMVGKELAFELKEEEKVKEEKEKDKKESDSSK